MSITEISIRKPAAVIMLVLLIIGLGFYGYTNLNADLFPTVNTPVITIITEYNGAAVSVIEKDILKPIEDELASISGIDTIRSGAVVGYGYTIVMFKMNVDINTAFMEVQQAMGVIDSKLPQDASKPKIKKYDKNAQPIIMLSVSGSLPYEQLASQADSIQQSLERLEGVGSVTLEGKLEKELQINIDKTKLDYYGVSLNTVVNKLKAENLNVPLGEIKQPSNNQPLQVLGEFKDIKEIQGLRIPVAGGAMVPLFDIAEVSLQYADTGQKLRLNGETSMGIFVQKQSDANIIDVTDRVKNTLAEMNKKFPEGLHLTIASDKSSFINATLKEVKKNLIEAIIFTALIIFLFLRNWRSSLIVLVSIPISLVATFFMMYVLGFSLNIITILALSVCIGILVDDSIVVLENIQRHMKMGKGPIQAAIEGRREIAMAAIAITLCDVVVFGPVAFLSDIVGQFFRQFGLTVVVATLFSLAVSFTITPMLSAKLIKGEQNGDDHKQETDKNPKPDRLNLYFEKVVELYKHFLIWALDHRWKVIAIITAGVVLSLALIPLGFIKSEFLPKTDRSTLTVNLSLAPGSNLNQTDRKVQEVEAYIKTLPEVQDFLVQIGSNNGDDETSAIIAVNLVDKTDRNKSQAQIVKELRTWGSQMDGIDFTVTEESLVGKTSIDGSKPIAINIFGGEYQVLQEVARKVESIVKTVPGAVDVDNSDKGTQSEYVISIDRVIASQLGMTTAEIASTLRTGVNGTQAGLFRKDGDEYNILVKIMDDQIKTVYDVGSIMISNSAGQQYRLDEMASISRSNSAGEVHRRDRQQLITIAADIQDRTLGDVDKEISQKLKSIDLPSGVTIKSGADQENMRTGFSSLIKALLFSIVLIYMILVVLYESYLTPLIRMMSIPCGVIGAFTALAITHNTLNIVTLIGLIMLDGLASKNGTLLIDYTNTLMKRGLPLREALIQSGTTRLRPILMTSVTMIVGMLPAALAMGAGSEIKAGMAISLIGGIVTSTLFSPILLPVVYTLMNDLKTYIANRKKGLEVQM